MIFVTDPEKSKVVSVNDTAVTIKPLSPKLLIDLQRAQVSISLSINENGISEPTTSVNMKVDRDVIAKLVEPSIIDIDRSYLPDDHSLKNANMLTYLRNIKEDDFWEIVAALSTYSSGLTKEEEVNLSSLSEQKKQASPASAQMPVKQAKGRVSTTKKRSSQKV